ncbi:MAG: PD-(D/E)XK motif protein [Cellulomonas sp.]|nr:PD-(D/E)XK motif protein [Cellulomonas sp.]
MPDGPTVASTAIALQVGGGSVRVGVDSEGHRHLLVPLAHSRPEVSDRSGTAVRLTTRPLTSEVGGGRYVDLECLRPDLDGVFTGLAADICLGLVSAPDDPGTTVRRHLENWRTLLGSGAQTWNATRLAGLTAELLVLEQLLGLDEGAVALWTGPDGAAQDFRSARHAIEVKASLTREGRLVRVHGTDQLEPPVGGVLGLVWFRLRQTSAENGDGLADLIARCLDGSSHTAMIERLGKLDFPGVASPVVREFRFEVVEQRWYLVDDGFPAISPQKFEHAAVPAGVGGVEYLVDLDVVTPELRPVGDLYAVVVEDS